MARPTTGGGAPSNWSSPAGSDGASLAHLPATVPAFQDVSLLDRIEGPWEPRNQGRRPTCTAFAVLAAEELAHALDTGAKEIEPLSEEFIYHRMRTSFPPSLDLSDETKEYMKKSGATFLDQAAQVLQHEGVCGAADLPYLRHPDDLDGHVADLSADQLATLKALAAPRKIDYARNTWVSPDGMKMDQPWRFPIGDLTVSQLVFAMLMQDIPSVVSLMIPVGSKRHGWDSDLAWECGRVGYRRPTTDDDYTAQDGHAVCVTGFILDPENSDRGWFVFRNSRGRYFAHNPAGDCPLTPPRPPARGYGVISAETVDAYCWEYVHRRPPGG